MKAKLIKVVIGDEYRLDDENGVLIASSLYSSKNKLSLKNCQAIERGYDLDELFNEVDESIDYHEFDFTSFRLGFQKAIELMGDKKYSLSDLKRGFNLGVGSSAKDTWDKWGLFTEFIQSLQQTEWDVEVETIEYGLGNDNDGRPVYETRCLLDADCCLILKRI